MQGAEKEKSKIFDKKDLINNKKRNYNDIYSDM